MFFQQEFVLAFNWPLNPYPSATRFVFAPQQKEQLLENHPGTQWKVEGITFQTIHFSAFHDVSCWFRISSCFVLEDLSCKFMRAQGVSRCFRFGKALGGFVSTWPRLRQHTGHWHQAHSGITGFRFFFRSRVNKEIPRWLTRVLLQGGPLRSF